MLVIPRRALVWAAYSDAQRSRAWYYASQRGALRALAADGRAWGVPLAGPQGPAIAPGSPRTHAAPATAGRTGPAVSLQRSDPLIRVHWVASGFLLLCMMGGFQLPPFGGLMFGTWEIHVAVWLLNFVLGIAP